MKSILVLMMATLLATATAVRAQTPPAPQPAPPPPYNPGKINGPGTVFNEEPGEPECPFAKALQEANVAWQRLRALCGAAKMGGCGEGGCAQTNACKATGCVVGVAGCAKGVAEAQAPKSCCCAKACACCETCKTAKAQTVQIQGPMTCPLCVPGAPCAPMMPPPTAGWKMQAGPLGVHIVAQAIPAPPMGMVPNFAYMPANFAAKPAKLVTPDFEAHCDQMIQRGDTIQLIGNVMLLCRKHAQPIRVEGQRILINLNDGSFVVEAGPVLPRPSTPAVGFGVMRMSINESGTIRPVGAYAQPCVPMGVCPRSISPATNLIEVVPVLPAPVTGPRPR